MVGLTGKYNNFKFEPLKSAMLQKTTGIILHQIKYTDSGVIVQFYTRDFGRQPVLVRGMNNRKSGRHNALFQPMSILNIVMYYKESREVQLLKEFSVAHAPARIYSDIRKSCIAVFLSEILSSVLREESSNHELFDYLEHSIKYLDGCEERFSNFHIAFLTGLSAYLGFEPGRRDDPSKKYFDLRNGSFVILPPTHPDYCEAHITEILARFFSAPFKEMLDIPLTGKLRNEVLETLVKYFGIHLPLLKKVNSTEILREIFR